MEDIKKHIVIFGSSGWIGSKITVLLSKHSVFSKYTIVNATSRLENSQDIQQEIMKYHNPPSSIVERVFNCAGKTGRPNVDWCENHKEETFQTNFIGTLNLASICHHQNIHLTYFGTGCVYSYNNEFLQPLESNCPFPNVRSVNENDPMNFTGSFYSKTKADAEFYLKSLYPNCLILRLRMPVSDDLHHRSLITKLIHYEKVVNIPNSLSVLHDLLPIAVDLSFKGKIGVYNFTNPGCLSHNQILQKYKDIVDSNFTWKNFTLEEQSKILQAPRSNIFLDSTKLQNEYPNLPNIDEALNSLFKRMKEDIHMISK